METLSMALRNWTIKFQNKFFDFDLSSFWLISYQLIAWLSTKIFKILYHLVCEIGT